MRDLLTPEGPKQMFQRKAMYLSKNMLRVETSKQKQAA